MIKHTLLNVLFFLLLAACSVMPLQLAPTTTPLKESDKYTDIGYGEGRSCMTSILFIPIQMGGSLHEALQEALHSREGADALINVTVDHKNYFFLLGASSCTEVRGTAIRFTEH